MTESQNSVQRHKYALSVLSVFQTPSLTRPHYSSIWGGVPEYKRIVCYCYWPTKPKTEVCCSLYGQRRIPSTPTATSYTRCPTQHPICFCTSTNEERLQDTMCRLTVIWKAKKSELQISNLACCWSRILHDFNEMWNNFNTTCLVFPPIQWIIIFYPSKWVLHDTHNALPVWADLLTSPPFSVIVVLNSC